jgi:hypothetical protein
MARQAKLPCLISLAGRLVQISTHPTKMDGLNWYVDPDSFCHPYLISYFLARSKIAFSKINKQIKTFWVFENNIVDQIQRASNTIKVVPNICVWFQL